MRLPFSAVMGSDSQDSICQRSGPSAREVPLPSDSGHPRVLAGRRQQYRPTNTVDYHAFWIGVKALCRRYDISAAQCIRKYGRGDNLSIGDSYMLKRAQDVRMSWKQTSPTPYEPGTGCYLDDVDWEAEVRQYENRQRPGRMDFKAMTLFRDGYRCRQCGTRVTYETSEADHIQPVSSFASYAQATHLMNLQTLCLECHKRKTSAE
jgi:hypothetical protein